MKLAIRAVDLDAIRTDGGTQVREGLDEAWVVELMGLYEEDHDIDPILLVLDPSGVHWLAHGFHRLEAQRRIGRSTVKAEVRDGPMATIDMARMLAAQANKNGRQLTAGDKKRAVVMARSTAEGRAMGVRELARHCGVTKSYVARILDDGCPLGDTTPSDSIRSVASAKGAANRHAALYRRIDEALRADVGRPDVAIAKDLGCGWQTVAERRTALGLPKSDPSRRKTSPTRDKAAEILSKHPEWTNARIAEEAGSSPITITKLRERLGIPASSHGPSARSVPKASPPSAPSRKGGDVRDGAEVIRTRTPNFPPPPPSGPAARSFASSAERDVAKGILDNLRIARATFRESSWSLLLEQMQAIVTVRTPEAAA